MDRIFCMPFTFTPSRENMLFCSGQFNGYLFNRMYLCLLLLYGMRTVPLLSHSSPVVSIACILHLLLMAQQCRVNTHTIAHTHTSLAPRTTSFNGNSIEKWSVHKICISCVSAHTTYIQCTSDIFFHSCIRLILFLHLSQNIITTDKWLHAIKVCNRRFRRATVDETTSTATNTNKDTLARKKRNKKKRPRRKCNNNGERSDAP